MSHPWSRQPPQGAAELAHAQKGASRALPPQRKEMRGQEGALGGSRVVTPLKHPLGHPSLCPPPQGFVLAAGWEDHPHGEPAKTREGSWWGGRFCFILVESPSVICPFLSFLPEFPQVNSDNFFLLLQISAGIGSGWAVLNLPHSQFPPCVPHSSSSALQGEYRHELPSLLSLLCPESQIS